MPFLTRKHGQKTQRQQQEPHQEGPSDPLPNLWRGSRTDCGRRPARAAPLHVPRRVRASDGRREARVQRRGGRRPQGPREPHSQPYRVCAGARRPRRRASWQGALANGGQRQHFPRARRGLHERARDPRLYDPGRRQGRQNANGHHAHVQGD